MKTITALFIGAALLAVALPAGASTKMVKQCKDAGIAEIKGCKSCHEKGPKGDSTDLTEVGQWLVAQKAAKKAADYDMAWLKEYYAKK
jgi:multimeric flavodoxin WrbA